MAPETENRPKNRGTTAQEAKSQLLRCDEGYIAKPMIQIDLRLTAVIQHLAQKTLGSLLWLFGFYDRQARAAP